MTPERPNETAERLWTVRDVAAFLQVSTSYVYKAAERGEVPCRRVGALLRFVPAEVRAWALGEPVSGARIASAPGDRHQ
jgi:excisionase family DNA binding protein